MRKDNIKTYIDNKVKEEQSDTIDDGKTKEWQSPNLWWSSWGFAQDAV